MCMCIYLYVHAHTHTCSYMHKQACVHAYRHAHNSMYTTRCLHAALYQDHSCNDLQKQPSDCDSSWYALLAHSTCPRPLQCKGCFVRDAALGPFVESGGVHSTRPLLCVYVYMSLRLHYALGDSHVECRIECSKHGCIQTGLE